MFGWPGRKAGQYWPTGKRSTPQGFWHTSLLPTRMQQDGLRTNISAEAIGSSLGESWTSCANGRELRWWCICLVGVEVWVQCLKRHIKKKVVWWCVPTILPIWEVEVDGSLEDARPASSDQCGKVLVQWETLSQPLGRRHLWADTQR